MNKDDKFYEQATKMAKIVDKATSKLLRDDFFLPFIPELLHYEIVYTDQLPAPAAVREDTETIFINPTMDLFNKYQNYEITAFLLLHEDLHVLLKHTDRLKHRDRMYWNWACDFVINLLLQALSKESRNSSKNKGTILNCDQYQYEKEFLINSCFDNMIEEEVYDKLIDVKTKKKTKSIPMKDFFSGGKGGSGGGNQSQPGKGDQKANGGGNGNDPEENDGKEGSGGSSSADIEKDGMAKITETEFRLGGQTYKHTDIEFPKIPANALGKNGRATKEDREARVGLSRQLIESNLSKGVGSDAIKNFLKKLFNVKIDWRKILADSIATAMETSSIVSWGKPRNSWLANAGYMPYLPSQEDEERFGTVVVAIDESGSMCDDDIRAAVSIIEQAKDHYKNILVLKHDDGINWEKKYDKDEVDINELLIRRHCGGTSHKQVFERVTKYLKEDPDGMVSCFIAVTDLYSDIESTQVLMPSDIPRVYLVNNDSVRTDGVQGRIIKLK